MTGSDVDSRESMKRIEWIRRAKQLIWESPEVRGEINLQGINVIPSNYYSTVPSVDEIENSFEYRTDAEIYNTGIFDHEEIKRFTMTLSAYSSEFDPPIEGDQENPSGYFWKAPGFSYSDAMAYYCILRHFKPDHVLEVGAGFSTLIADAAIRRNGAGRLTLIEPYPRKFLRSLDTVDRMVESAVQDIPISDAIELVESSDIWFIDSTHTVKTGSDCLYMYLKVMPEVKRDLVVHTHDVFLPFGMPKNWALRKHIYWTEQYLLYAYMLDNPKVEVLFGSTYVNRRAPDAMRALMRGRYRGGGGSLWYRLKGSLSGRVRGG